jgi:hypothetical protein
MWAAILLASANSASVAPPVVRVTAVARARIISAPRLDLRSPPKRIEGARRSKRSIDFE